MITDQGADHRDGHRCLPRVPRDGDHPPFVQVEQRPHGSAPGSSGCKKTTSLLYKMEMDFGDLQIIELSRIFIQIIGLSLFSPDYRISTREY